MANEKNLVRNDSRTPSERRELARKAGIASGKSRREKKSMREALILLMSLPAQNNINEDRLEKLGISGSDANNQMLLLATIMREGFKGNYKAWEFIRDTMGEKPMDIIEVLKPISETAAELDKYIDGKKNERKPKKDA